MHTWPGLTVKVGGIKKTMNVSNNLLEHFNNERTAKKSKRSFLCQGVSVRFPMEFHKINDLEIQYFNVVIFCYPK